jgi:hypothetical protein
MEYKFSIRGDHGDGVSRAEMAVLSVLITIYRAASFSQILGQTYSDEVFAMTFKMPRFSFRFA